MSGEASAWVIFRVFRTSDHDFQATQQRRRSWWQQITPMSVGKSASKAGAMTSSALGKARQTLEETNEDDLDWRALSTRMVWMDEETQDGVGG